MIDWKKIEDLTKQNETLQFRIDNRPTNNLPDRILKLYTYEVELISGSNLETILINSDNSIWSELEILYQAEINNNIKKIDIELNEGYTPIRYFDPVSAIDTEKYIVDVITSEYAYTTFQTYFSAGDITGNSVDVGGYIWNKTNNIFDSEVI